MLIVYCESCGHRVPEEELKAAVKVDENNYFCARCAAARPAASVVPAKEAKGKSGARHPQPAASTPEARHSVSRQTPVRSTRSAAAVEKRDTVRTQNSGQHGDNTKVTIMATVAVAVVVGLVVVFSDGSKPAGPQANANAPVGKGSVPPAQNVVAERAPLPDRPTQVPDAVKEEDFRGKYARTALEKAKAAYQQQPGDSVEYAEELRKLTQSYAMTEAGEEARQILATLKVTAPTPEQLPQGSGEWVPIFDGKTLECLTAQARKGWRVADGVLEQIVGDDNAGQTRAQLEDGEFRFRFELKPVDGAFFCARQSNKGSVMVDLSKQVCAGLQGKQNELIIYCYRKSFSAKLNGEPIRVQVNGAPYVPGALQFNSRGSRGLRILAIEQSKLAAATGTLPSAANSGTDSEWKNAVNLLALIDPQKDAVEGSWKMEQGALSVGTRKNARLQIPYVPPEEFDLKLVFTRVSEDGSVGPIVPKNGSTWFWSMGYGNACVFEYGADAANDPTRVPFAFENGRKYSCVLLVRNEGVTAYLDGRRLVYWKTDFKGFEIFRGLKLKDTRLLGLVSQYGGAVFHSFELLERKGKGAFMRGAPANAK